MSLKASEIKSFYTHLMKFDLPKISIPQKFVEWLIAQKNLSELEALEVVDVELSKLKRLVENDIKYHESKYTYAKFQFSIYDPDILIATHFDYEDGDKKIVSYKIAWWEKLNELIKTLDWRAFEILAEKVLKENGVSDITITRAQNDQGIDFYGYLTFPSTKLMYRLYKDLHFKIVGQVKHSSSHKGVDHQKIASFGTEIKKLRNQNNYTTVHF